MPSIRIIARSGIYESAEADDFGTVTIIKIQNNNTDGVFTARLTRRGDNAKVEVTGGQFKNVEMTHN